VSVVGFEGSVNDYGSRRASGENDLGKEAPHARVRWGERGDGDAQLDFVHFTVSSIRPVPGDKVQTWEFLSGVDCAPMLNNSRHPTDAAGQRPTHRRTWHETCRTRRSFGWESSHWGATHGPAVPRPSRGRTDKGWCARLHDPTTVVAFRSRDELGSPQRWFRWSSA
jgi:hypothetical protein